MIIEKEDYKFLKEFNFKKEYLTTLEQQDLLIIFNKIYGQNRQMTSCNACWREILGLLQDAMNNRTKK